MFYWNLLIVFADLIIVYMKIIIVYHNYYSLQGDYIYIKLLSTNLSFTQK